MLAQRDALCLPLSAGLSFPLRGSGPAGQDTRGSPILILSFGELLVSPSFVFLLGHERGTAGGRGGEGGSGTYPESGQTFSHHFGRTLMPTSHWIVFALGVLHPPKDLGLGWLQLFSGTVVGLLTGCGPHRHATSLPPLLRVPANQCFP